MKKLNKTAALISAAAIALANTAPVFAGNTGSYTYLGPLSEISISEPEEKQPENSSPLTSQRPEEAGRRECEPFTQEQTVKPSLPEITTKKYITETTTKAVIETSTETTTEKPAQTTTKQTPAAETTTQKQTETTTRQTRTTESSTETTTEKQTSPAQTTTEAQTETTTAASSSSSSSSASSTAQQVLQLVNEERAAAGLSALTLDSSLTYAAQLKAQDMADNGYFSHTSPTYGTPSQMLSSLGISYKYAGENIAKGQKTAEAVMEAWMNSSGHKANILSSSYGKIGVGCVYQNGTVYWVQIFTD